MTVLRQADASAPTITSQEAAQELLRRKAARHSMLNFCTYTSDWYVVSAMRRLVCEYMDAVRDGLIKRLMIFTCPQYGKSEIVSRRFIPHYLGHFPDHPLMLLSHGEDLAVELSKDARRIMLDDPYQRLFGNLSPYDVELDQTTNSGSLWRLLDRRGGLRATGVGGSVTGRPAKGIVIDDPVKNRQDASSKRMQKVLIDEYDSTIQTRLDPQEGWIVLMHTRWHKFDMAGQLLLRQHEGGEKWVVVRLPLVCETPSERRRANEMMGIIERPDPLGRNPKDDPLGRKPGDPLDPARHDKKMCKQLAAGPSIVYSSIWQQAPRPVEGNLIKRHWFEIVQKLPADCEVPVSGWDLAATEPQVASDDPDWTVRVLMTRKKVANGYIYFIIDVVRGRQSPLGTEKLLVQTAQLDGVLVHMWIEQEGGSSGKLLVRPLRAIFHEADSRFVTHFAPPKGDKLTRAWPWINQAEAGNVKLLAGKWNKDFLDEVEEFPDGGHDDQIDGCSICYEALNSALRTKKPKTHR